MKNKSVELFNAIKQASETGYISDLEYLIDEGIDLNQPINPADTALTYAARLGNTKVVEFLIANKAEVNPIGMPNFPINEAVLANNMSMIALLLKNGATVNSTNYHTTPLITAINHIGDEQTVDLLLKFGANINQANSHSETPLITALRIGKFDIAEKLVKLGADPKVMDGHGNTAISLLKLWNNQDMLDLINSINDKAIQQLLNDRSNKIDIIANQLATSDELPSPKDWREYSKQIKQKSPYYRDAVEITAEDYTELVKKVGSGAPAGIKVEFEKDGYSYTCTFKEAPLSFKPTSIHVKEVNYDNTLVHFNVLTYSTDCLALNTSLILEDKDYTHTSKKAKFFDYCIKHGKQQYKYNKFIVGSQILIQDSFHTIEKIKDLKKNSITKFIDGKIYNNQGQIFETDETLDYIYVIDKKGKLFVNTVQEAINHHLFLIGKEQKPWFTYGKESACSGHLKIKDGKIIEINNMSGHYQPNKDQMKLVGYYLHKQNVLDNSVILKARETAEEFGEYNLTQIANLDVNEILSRYNEMPNFDDASPVCSDIQASIDVSAIGVGQNIMEAIY